METMYYIDIPVVIVAIYESLNIAKVKNVHNQMEFYVDKQFVKKCPNKGEASLSIAQLKGRQD